MASAIAPELCLEPPPNVQPPDDSASGAGATHVFEASHTNPL